MHLMTGDDEMIQHPNVHQCQCFLQCLCQRIIGSTRFGAAGRVVMGQDDACSVMRERGFHDFSRIYAGMRERAAKQFLGRDQAIFNVKKKYRERFMAHVSKQ